MNTPQDMLDDGGPLQRCPSKGSEIVEKHRPEMNNLTAAEREEYYLRGMQMIYTKWWPIVSAPKDGTHILMYRKSGVNEAWWRENIFKTAFEWGGASWAFPEDYQPTHWMPLPPAP